MMEWHPERMERLYELYERHFDGLRRDVAAANLSLGSPCPKKTKLERLAFAEFKALLTDPTNDLEAIQLWVRRIIRGHEDEFPSLQAAG